MKPPQEISRDRAVLRKQWYETLARRRRHELALPLVEPLAAGHIQDRRNQIYDMPWRVSQFPAYRDALWPLHDQRGRDAAFVDPGLVPAERRVGQARPARPDAQERRPSAALGVGVVAIPADHDLGTR